ncbi:MAG: ferrochelatase [Bryobacterales bacterium]|nr:ferrochelatase [Bryobacterales bacterium]
MQPHSDLPYQAILFLSFGGPDQPEDVMPFLENVLRGRNVPKERMGEVAEHYYHFGGKSPINEQNLALIDALRKDLDTHGLAQLPIYFGNRNWHPLLTDTMAQMAADGVKRALCFITSSFSCYSGCRQYRENIAAARLAVGESAPQVDKIRVWYNHPLFVEAIAHRVKEALVELPVAQQDAAVIVFTAHSIPNAMADTSDYVKQLEESCRLVAEAVGGHEFVLVYQSRSGPPHQPWLEPDIGDFIRQRAAAGKTEALVVAPIGFVSDHMEVMFDLDEEARQICDEVGIPMARSRTAGTHPSFVRMIRLLIEERLQEDPVRLAIGDFGPNHDVCPENCCPAMRPAASGRPGAPLSPAAS